MIIVRLTGGMGNQMFQYAFGRFLSLKHNVPLKFDKTFLLDRTPRPKWMNYVFRNYDLDIFNVNVEDANRTEIPFLLRPWFHGYLMLGIYAIQRKFISNPGKENSISFQPDKISLGPNTYLEGFWQSPKYFESIESIIREDFKLRNPLSEKSQVLFNEIRSSRSVCINVRRADFVTSNFHGTFGPEYYDMAVKHLSSITEFDKIYVFSDDVKWCEENLKFDFPTMFVSHEYAGKKFAEYIALMTACKHFIIPNSSFAWWAAWLNTDSNKVVIAPKRWFLDESIDTTELIPKEWIRI